MIYVLIVVILVVLTFLANLLYKKIVLYDTQEEQIIRGKKMCNAYDVVSFGSSYARYAFDFSNSNLKGFNFGLLPQFLYYTDKMIRDYRKSYKHNALVFIVLPVLVFAESGKGKYGSQRYAKLLSKKALEDEFTIKGLLFVKLFPLLRPSLYNLKICIKNIMHYKDVVAEYNIEVNSLNEEQVKVLAKKRCKDWIKEFKLIDTQTDVIPTVLEKKFIESREILTGIIDYCVKEGLRPVLVVTPVSKQMKEELSDRFLKKVLYDNIQLANKANIPFLDYLEDERFSHFSNYANNSDFLNAKARKKFSQIVIDDALKKYSNLPISKSVYNIGKDECCGCMMCGDICNKQAITFPIERGFWYPHVDNEKCTNCGLCKKRCPVLNINMQREYSTVEYYGVKTRNEDIRWYSTSGGFFSELAHFWISDFGIVVGAAYDDNCTIVHYIGTSEEDIIRLRQSKYAQSRTEGIYKTVKDMLIDGKKILFCGTPCQVEALYSFLGKRPDNLLTMDFFCLGICSPWVYRKYLDMLESQYKTKVSCVWFKNKTYGWRSISTKVDFVNGKTYLVTGNRDPFMRAFVADALSIRPNCQNCKFRSKHHISDFTVGDFWGLEKVNPDVDDNKGMSALMINTDKAHAVFSQIKVSLDYFATTYDDIVRDNFSVEKPLAMHPKLNEFMDFMEQNGFKAAIYKYSSLTRKETLKNKLCDMKRLIKHILKR
ncbi:Coenzyme F420 hydrogenase/dehydrogenase, beta subunit C-terminal domain [Bacteroides intestinalis]|jgi:coenzyme F420-reducing hydrogenase beta subunit|uniref:4Fe-4S ferredoxin-type domain-containing protein n=1 Tax=Bacteroides intestinalis TaxID=329854 RepID=A0A415N9D9_9BACE|nr:Coenzyme F420 hydrogenase/dehydrogenase, beta subunit C-terminal domain [Bacteroides intestinalis]RHL93213.1 hypothetical protein DWZ95_10420 [Bacteroides intestinalis]